jgi:hypothetical protein
LQKAEVYFGDVNRIQIQVRFMNVSLAVEWTAPLLYAIKCFLYTTIENQYSRCQIG